MPAVHLTKEQERVKAAARFLRRELVSRDIDRRQLAKRVNMKYDTLAKRIREPGSMRLSELWRIMDVLKTPQEERGEILK